MYVFVGVSRMLIIWTLKRAANTEAKPNSCPKRRTCNVSNAWQKHPNVPRLRTRRAIRHSSEMGTSSTCLFETGLNITSQNNQYRSQRPYSPRTFRRQRLSMWKHCVTWNALKSCFKCIIRRYFIYVNTCNFLEFFTCHKLWKHH